MNITLTDYIVKYNELVSKAATEQTGKFSFLASPTLNKQETISFLYENLINHQNIKTKKNLKFESLKMYLGFLPRITLMLLRLIKTSLKFRIRSFPENFIYIRTWLVPRSIHNGVVKDDYFRQLIDDLSEEKNVVVGFQPLGYDNTLQQFHKANKPDNYIIPVGLLSLFDIVMIFWKYIFSGRVILKNQYFFNELQVTDKINHSLKIDYFNLRSFQAYLELAIAKKIKTHNPVAFLYIFENQAWENAYLHTFKDSKTRTIGYQSSGFSFRFLNFFPSRIDSKVSLFPDKILTVGNNFTRTMKEYGHYPIPIETFGALRFDFPTLKNNYIIEEPSLEIHKRILYAFPVHFYQYEKITYDLIDVFKGSEIEVYLKYHPLFQITNKDVQLPSNFKIWSKHQKQKLKSTYDLVIFNDNSFGIESLIMGVKSYEYEFGEIYDENRLFNFDLYFYRIDKNGLIKIRDQIKNSTLSKDFNKEFVQKYIGNMYTAYDGKYNQIIN